MGDGTFSCISHSAVPVMDLSSLKMPEVKVSLPEAKPVDLAGIETGLSDLIAAVRCVKPIIHVPEPKVTVVNRAADLKEILEALPMPHVQVEHVVHRYNDLPVKILGGLGVTALICDIILRILHL